MRLVYRLARFIQSRPSGHCTGDFEAMNFSALALDYDGTIAVDGVFDPAVRDAVGDARRRGIVVIGHVPSGAEEAHGQVGHSSWHPA